MKKPLNYESMHRIADRIENAGTHTRQHEAPLLSRADLYYIQKNPDKLSMVELAQMYSIPLKKLMELKNKNIPVLFDPR